MWRDACNIPQTVQKTWGTRSHLCNPYRYIIYRGYMEAGKDYYLHLVNLAFDNNKGKSGMKCWYRADLMELVPESVFNNPNKAEDWW